MCGIQVFFKWFSLNTQALTHFKVSLMYKALDRSVHRNPKFKGVFTIHHLQEILHFTETLPFSNIYKTIYLFAYFGFLCISNLVPPSKKSFSLKKHLCRADVLLNSTNVVVLIKWSKTLQATNQGSYIVLPKFKNVEICPFYHFNLMCQRYPVPKNFPCFGSVRFCVVESVLRNHLRSIVTSMGLDPLVYTSHTFRRSGATLAHNLDISIENIKRHGTWQSDAVNSYIIDDPQRASAVAASLARFFDSHQN